MGYINNDVRHFHTFVANGVQKIRQSTEPKQWLYVPTDQNPADNASRGGTIKELLSSNWFSGPSFLWEREIATSDVVLDLPVGDPEVKKIQTLQTKTEESKDLVDHLSRFSSWSKTLKAMKTSQKVWSASNMPVSKSYSYRNVKRYVHRCIY